MDVGDQRWAHVGSVHRVPVRDVRGGLHLCGLDVVGPDPAAVLDHVNARFLVCLQTDEEIRRRYPDYLGWLADPTPHEALWLPTEDHLVTDDGAVEGLVGEVHGRLRSGANVVVHCGAGWGRAGVVAVLVMVASGATTDDALRDLRRARPAAGPQSPEQDAQVERLAARLTRRC